ncbi:MAG: single-stranded DNA-binding protein [Clostridia bacterium]
MLEDNNRALISGNVVSEPIFDHNLYGENFFCFDIDVLRKSGVFDTIKVTISDRLFDPFALAIGENIAMQGQLRSYNKHIDNANRLIITFFCKQFERVENPENVNDITLTGYICKPVIYRTTPFMREIADILIAVNRSYSKSDYLPCIVWGRNARYASELSVGTALTITGRIQSRKYQKQITEATVDERTAYEISCSSIITLEI